MSTRPKRKDKELEDDPSRLVDGEKAQRLSSRRNSRTFLCSYGARTTSVGRDLAQ